MAKTIVGLYDDFTTAQKVSEDLVNKGFDRNDVSVVANNVTREYDQYATSGTNHEDDMSAGEGAMAGAGIGAAIGGVGGLILGLGLLTIPGVGPALAAGPIVSALTGAGIGAIAGGLAGALVNMGVPEEEAGTYAEGVRRGGTLVAVRAEDNRTNDVAAIMNRHNPVDVDERSANWRSEGWTEYSPKAEPYTAEQITEERAKRIPIIEEDLKVGKRAAQTGGAQVRSYVTETPVEEDVHLRREHVEVERRAVDRPASEKDLKTFQEGTMEVNEMAEEVVVSKQARVIEEVVIGKEVEEHTETVRDTIRKTNVDVSQTNKEHAVGAFDATFDADYRNHFKTNYKGRDHAYDDYLPVYRYGHSLGTNEQYRNREWKQVEPDARRNWEQRNPGTWDEFKDSIHYAWTKARR